MKFVFATDIRQVLDAALESTADAGDDDHTEHNGTARPRRRKSEKAAAKA